MTRLLRAEWLRLRSRRAAVLMVFGLALLATTIAGGAALLTSSDPPSEEALRQARETVQAILQECERDPACDPAEAARLNPVEYFYDDERFVMARDAEVPLAVFSVIVAIASIMVGASFIGSEGHHSTLGNLLLWEPRRARVVLGKSLTVGAAAGAASLALGLFLFAGLWVVAAVKGVTTGPEGYTSELLARIGRGSALAVFGALVGAGLTLLARSTAAGLGIALAYLAAAERFLAVLRPRWQPWLAGDLAVAIMAGEHAVYIPGELVRHELPDGGFSIGERVIVLSAGRGALVLAAYVAVLLAVAVAEFRRRNVT